MSAQSADNDEGWSGLQSFDLLSDLRITGRLVNTTVNRRIRDWQQRDDRLQKKNHVNHLTQGRCPVAVSLFALYTVYTTYTFAVFVSLIRKSLPDEHCGSWQSADLVTCYWSVVTVVRVGEECHYSTSLPCQHFNITPRPIQNPRH